MLSQTAEYALRAVCALASRLDELVPTSELAKSTDVPPPYLAKVLQQLAAADLIRGRRGVGGGYKLVRDPSDITMLDVVNSVSVIRKARSNEELQGNLGFGELDQAIDQAAAAIVERFSSVTIDRLAQDIDAAKAQLGETRSADMVATEARPTGPVTFPTPSSSARRLVGSNGFSNGNGSH